MSAVGIVLSLLRALLLGRGTLAAEDVALRQQLIVLQRSVKRTRLRRRDRLFWVWLCGLWRDWSSCLLIVKPDTGVRWHRQGFRLFWRWK
jgi:putative transposase